MSQQVTDASVATVGPGAVDRADLQLAGPADVAGVRGGLVVACWTCRWSPIRDGSGALILTLADGQQVRFAKNAAGGYAPPQDYVRGRHRAVRRRVLGDRPDRHHLQLRPGQRVVLADVRRSPTSTGQTETFSYSSGDAGHDHQHHLGAGAAPHLVHAQRRQLPARGDRGHRPGDRRAAGHGADLDLRLQRRPAHLGVPAGHHHRVHQLRVQHQRLARRRPRC